jgi:hypothetical protein
MPRKLLPCPSTQRDSDKNTRDGNMPGGGAGALAGYLNRVVLMQCISSLALLPAALPVLLTAGMERALPEELADPAKGNLNGLRQHDLSSLMWC